MFIYYLIEFLLLVSDDKNLFLNCRYWRRKWWRAFTPWCALMAWTIWSTSYPTSLSLTPPLWFLFVRPSCFCFSANRCHLSNKTVQIVLIRSLLVQRGGREKSLQNHEVIKTFTPRIISHLSIVLWNYFWYDEKYEILHWKRK